MNIAGLRVRPMDAADVDEAARVSAAAFGVPSGDPYAAARWRDRVAHLIDTDPAGAFVAERDGQLIGAAEAICRERLWCLSLLAVDSSAQGAGAGRALLDAALGYDDGTDARLVVSSNDARALALARSSWRATANGPCAGSPPGRTGRCESRSRPACGWKPTVRSPSRVIPGRCVPTCPARRLGDAHYAHGSR